MLAQIEVKQVRELFALRYQVYCIEKGFLAKEEYPNGEESDPFDAGAVHFAAVDRAGEVVGSVRLVPHTPGIGFPYQEHCRNLFSGGKELPIENAAEISRLLVSKSYLRRSIARKRRKTKPARRPAPSRPRRSACLQRAVRHDRAWVI